MIRLSDKDLTIFAPSVRSLACSPFLYLLLRSHFIERLFSVIHAPLEKLTASGSKRGDGDHERKAAWRPKLLYLTLLICRTELIIYKVTKVLRITNNSICTVVQPLIWRGESKPL